MNYLNEWSPYHAQWCRNLAEAGEIPACVVDETDIRQVTGDRLNEYDQCHFFAGIAGWPLALKLAGVPDNFPVWTGSCPCQPFAACGRNTGMSDERNVWLEFFRLISQCRPACVFGEQSADSIGKGWLDAVCDDMDAIGFTVWSPVIPACGAGAPHIRKRLYWVAHSDLSRFSGWRINRDRPEQKHPWSRGVGVRGNAGRTRPIEPGVFPLAYGLPRSVGPGGTRSERMGLVAAKANRVGRIHGYGNAIVPELAAMFVRVFFESVFA